MMRNRVALLTALGVDNVGSGLFLPVALLYVTRVVGLPLATAGTVVAIGTMAGLAVPPVAGRLVDRVGPRLTVISAQSLQALGAAAYLVARNPASVAVAAVLLAVGQQMFYSSGLPWLLVGTCAALAVLALRWLAGHLPAGALRPEHSAHLVPF
jgi:MFS family permease